MQFILTQPTGNQPRATPTTQTPQSTPTARSEAEPDAALEARHSLATHVNLDTSFATTLLINRLNTINYFFSKPVIRKLGFTKDTEFSILVQVYLMNRP